MFKVCVSFAFVEFITTSWSRAFLLNTKRYYYQRIENAISVVMVVQMMTSFVLWDTTYDKGHPESASNAKRGVAREVQFSPGFQFILAFLDSDPLCIRLPFSSTETTAAAVLALWPGVNPWKEKACHTKHNKADAKNNIFGLEYCYCLHF